MVGFPSLRARLERRLKTTLAGTDLEALVRNRDRRRLRWLCQESTDPLLRFRALRALSELIDPQSQDIFLRMVHLPAGEVPTIELCIAAQSLARLVCRESTAPLIRLLETSRPVAVNLAAARALASLGSPADWEAVRRWVERSAVEGLTYPDLRDLLYPDEVSEPANQSAVFVLQVLYPEKGVVWWESKAATGGGSSEAAPGFSSEGVAGRVVAQSLRSSLERERLGDEEFRHKALLLGNLARDRDYDFLREQLGKERLQRARTIRIALSLIADPRGVAQMRQDLERARSQGGEELADALRCAGRYAHRDLVGPISESWLSDLDEACRTNLIWALGECGGGEATGKLLDLVRSREERLNDSDFAWIGRSLLRCGMPGKEAVRGGLTIARAGGGERQRMERLATSMGLS